MITIPRTEYEAMQARINDLDDILAGHAAMTGDTLPRDLAVRVMEGEHPARVWREHKGFTAAALADKVGISKPYLSEIENGRKPGSVEVYRNIAAALGVAIDAVVP